MSVIHGRRAGGGAGGGGISVESVRTTPLTTAAEVLVATGHDAFARATLRFELAQGWVGEDATAWIGTDQHERVPYLSALGNPGAVGALLGEIVPELPPRQRVTVPRGTSAKLPDWAVLHGIDWDFRWVDAPPAEQPAEHRVVALEDDAELTAFLKLASPTASALPGDVGVRHWLGVRAHGSLLACAADTSSSTGVGHLSSIAVTPQARGQGLGRAVTAALTRRLLAGGCDIVTLGMYATNTAGRGMYDALGFNDDHHFTSGPLRVRT